MTARRRVPPALTVLALLAAACLPAPVTVEARRTAELYTIFVGVAIVVAVVVIGLALFAILRYRRRGDDDALPPQVHGNNRLEAAWTLVPLVTVGVLLALTVVVLNSFEDARKAAATVDLRVTAFRWGWRFEYPGQDVSVEGVREPGPEAYVPVGENIHVTLLGNDVVHAFYVPRFLFKQDVIPGRENTFAFTVDEPGRYGGQCAEFCGVYHSGMPFTIVAVPRAEYEAWLASHRPPAASPEASP